jgi:aspartokinase
MRTDIISGILQRLNLSAFMISSVFKTADTGQIFRHLSQNRINVEFINQVPLKNGRSDVILCVDSSNRYSVSTELEKLKSLIHARNIVQIQNVGVLSIFPHKEHAFVISSIIQSLTAEGIPVLAMGNSLSSVSCVIEEEKVPDAIQSLSKEFGLS